MNRNPVVVTVEGLEPAYSENPANRTQAILEWHEQRTNFRKADMPAEIKDPSVESDAEKASKNKTQKLAALLVMLGPEGAGVILKPFRAQIEATRERCRFQFEIPPGTADEISAGSFRGGVSASTSVRQEVESTRATAGETAALFKASDIRGKLSRLVHPRRDAKRSRRWTLDTFSLLSATHRLNHRLRRHHLKPRRRAKSLGLLRAEQRDQVIERLRLLRLRRSKSRSVWWDCATRN